jgi:hypothetical protein
MPVQTVIKVRRDTAANWTSTNPTLAAGEMGLETDTELFKFGNGTSAWTALAYSSSSRITQIAKNDTGSSAAKGSVVYISGANGSNALFSLADADAEVTSSKTVGLLAQTLASNGIGAVVTEGLLSGVNTGSATAGQSVWLSSTAGGFVFNAPPAKPAHSVYLGVVTRAHSTQGEILVKVQNGYELNELHDVNAGSPADNNVLAWDSASSMWINQTAAQAGLAAASHTHAQSDITGLSTDLAAKAPLANPTFTGTVAGITKSMVGLGNVDNTTDAGKPISTATQTALDLKAPLASPTFTGTTTDANLTVTGTTKIKPIIETATLVATGFAGYTFNVKSNAVVYITANATANGTLNIRGDGSTTLASMLAVGESLTVTLLSTNTSTAYYVNAVQVDGTATGVTTKWLGGTAPTSGNASAVDAYTFTVIKTASATFTVFGSVSKFA